MIFLHKYLRDYKKNSTFAADIEKYAQKPQNLITIKILIIMKVQNLFLAFAVAAMCLTACDEQQVMPGDNDNNQAALVIPNPTPDPEGFNVPEGAIDVYKAVEIAKSLKFGEVTKERYLIKGYLTSFNRGETFKDDFPKYGNDFFYISAVQPSDDQPINNFYAYRALGKYGAKFPDLECVKEGDFVVISCFITNYNGVFESSGTCFTVASNNEHFNNVFPKLAPVTLKGDEISISDAEAITSKLADGETTSDRYKLRGYVCSIDYSKTDTTFNNPEGRHTFTFNITDGKSCATAYGMYHAQDKEDFTSLKQLQLWDEVALDANLQNYRGTCEPTQGWVYESSNKNF